MFLQSPGETAFTIYGISIYWYSVMILISILIGVIIANKFAYKFNLPKDFWIENSPLLIVCGIIFARAYYCAANYEYFFKYPAQVLNIRGGGLSIHGVILGGIIYLICLAKIKRIAFFNIADSISFVLPLCQSIGRWGNFFNSEAFGLPTKSNWGVYIPLANRPAEYINYEYFHPTFLYESILDLFVFITLAVLIKKKPKSGTIFLVYLILYSVIRIAIEQIRTDSVLNINGIPLAQVVSAAIMIFAIIILIIRKRYN